MACAGCAPPAPQEAPTPPPKLERTPREPAPFTPTNTVSDGALSTSRVAGTSPAADFATLHAAHVDAIARAHGAPLAATARIQLPNALEHHGNLYALVSVALLNGDGASDDFDPHAPRGSIAPPNAESLALLQGERPALKKRGSTLRGAADLALNTPACTQCHADADSPPATLLYTFREIADD